MTRTDREANQRSDAVVSSKTTQFLEAILPASVRSAEIEERSEARILVGLAFVLIGVSAVIVLFQLLHGTLFGVAGGLILGGIHVALLLALRTEMPIRILSQIMIGTIFAFSAGIMIASGGQAAAAVLVACLIPLVSVLLAGRKSSLGWTLATLVGVGLTAVYANTTDTFLYSGEILVWDQARFPSIVAIVSFVYVGAIGFERARSMALDEARTSKDQLEIQDARYRSLVENMGDIMMEFDEDGSCLYVNPNCFEVMGRREDEFFGEKYIDLVHWGDQKNLLDSYQLLKKKSGSSNALPLRILHSDGHWIFGQLSARCYLTDSGRIHFVTIYRDLTELRSAELAIRHTERLASTGTLAAGIAHQINNPIGSILNASEYALLCLKDGSLDVVRSALEDNIEQAARCGRIVRSLLHFATREISDKKREDLVEIVRHAMDFTASYAGERSIEIELTGDPGPLWIEVSSIEIEQVLVNLIRNSIESEPVSQRVQVVASRVGTLARFEVRDDGHGISDANRAQVFDPFFTTRMRDGGSGLGLSLAHGIIRDHDGTMDLESSEGKGTCVRVELPLTTTH